MRCASMLLVAGVSALLAAGCGQVRGSSQADSTSDGWVSVADVPLSPREEALGIWTGSETLLLGGSDAKPCPATADCVAPDEPPLRDGTAFDPVTRTWRPLADAPHGFSGAEGLVLDGIAYVFASGTHGRPGADPVFMAYDIANDRWTELPTPANRWASITVAGDKLVAFSTSDEVDAPADFVFDPSTEAWAVLPDDPLPPSYDRTMAWDGDELVLFAKEIVSQPNSTEPSVALAAALNLESGEWRRLPASESLDQFVGDIRWFESGGLLINPAPGRSDGGPINGWDRSYPYGGVLDAEHGQWLGLPESPPGVERSVGAYGAGMIDADEAHYFATDGWILDAEADRWIEIPRLDTKALMGRSTVTRAGLDMLVFGGSVFDSAGRGTLTNDAWTWSPAG